MSSPSSFSFFEMSFRCLLRRLRAALLSNAVVRRLLPRLDRKSPCNRSATMEWRDSSSAARDSENFWTLIFGGGRAADDDNGGWSLLVEAIFSLVMKIFVFRL